jgi:hypothetical protein
VRLFGRWSVTTRDEPGFEELAGRFPSLPGARSVVSVALDRVADSCGYGVPRMEFVEQRDRLLSWADGRGDAGLQDYRTERNRESIDGLPGY